jgi:acyl-CoA thioester hydrolase
MGHQSLQSKTNEANTIPLRTPLMSQPAYIHRLRVRYGETDQMGVVHHANYVLYAEEARTELMRHHGSSYAQMEKDGYALPVRSMQLRFRSPAHYEDELEIHTHVATLRGASVTFHSEMYRAGDRTHLATVEVELACISLLRTPRRPVALPEALRANLEPLLVAQTITQARQGTQQGA